MPPPPLTDLSPKNASFFWTATLRLDLVKCWCITGVTKRECGTLNRSGVNTSSNLKQGKLLSYCQTIIAIITVITRILYFCFLSQNHL